MSADSLVPPDARDTASLLEATRVDVGDGLVSLSVALRANALRAIDALPNDVALRVLCATARPAEAPEPIPLVVTRILAPKSADELTPLEREQLRAAARGYDEQDLDAAARLTDDGSETSMHGGVVLRTIASANGVPLYDAYTYAADAGAFFRAGTMEQVAWVGQGGGVVLAEKNEPLRQALGVAIGPGAVVRLAKAKNKRKKAK